MWEKDNSVQGIQGATESLSDRQMFEELSK